MMKLKDIHSPDALKTMDEKDLPALAQEIREEIIATVSENGGHLASNLGIVELTIALHRVFDMKKDRLVFDVGHQCYAHKLLTGRYGQFSSLRKTGGISGFPRGSESPYDHYDTGHASAAISAALGMARARDLKKEDYAVLAVVGDGALTGGMCYEALNDAGSRKTGLIVILNDNGMSISGNVGALSNYLTNLRLSKGWLGLKKAVSGFLRHIPFAGQFLYRLFQRLKDHIRNVFVQDTFFSSLGFRYLGPIDGHDIHSLQRVLKKARMLKEPVVIHVVTKKGNGYRPAENQPELFHGIPPFQMESGRARQTDPDRVFGLQACRQVMDIAGRDDRTCVVTAAMTEGTGFTAFKEKFPDRLFDVGIAEEHALSFAAGLAKNGMRPVVAIYDTFLQRGFDQITEDIALQHLPVLLLADRAGLNGADGSTHHGIFGTAFLSAVPGLNVLYPRNILQMRAMIENAFQKDEPTAILYPKGEPENALCPADGDFSRYTLVHDEGADGAILAVGTMAEDAALCAIELKKAGIGVRVYSVQDVRHVDSDLMQTLALQQIPFFTLEEHVHTGGFGSMLSLWCADRHLPAPELIFSLPDSFVTHGSREDLLKGCGLDLNGICAKITDYLAHKGR